jgi:hypothetical protein
MRTEAKYGVIGLCLGALLAYAVSSFRSTAPSGPVVSGATKPSTHFTAHTPPPLVNRVEWTLQVPPYDAFPQRNAYVAHFLAHLPGMSFPLHLSHQPSWNPQVKVVRLTARRPLLR